MEILDSFEKTSLDTDLRRGQDPGGARDHKTDRQPDQGAAESPEGTEMKDMLDMSETALFDSMLRLGLPTDPRHRPEEEVCGGGT